MIISGRNFDRFARFPAARTRHKVSGYDDRLTQARLAVRLSREIAKFLEVNF